MEQPLFKKTAKKFANRETGFSKTKGAD